MCNLLRHATTSLTFTWHVTSLKKWAELNVVAKTGTVWQGQKVNILEMQWNAFCSKIDCCQNKLQLLIRKSVFNIWNNKNIYVVTVWKCSRNSFLFLNFKTTIILYHYSQLSLHFVKFWCALQLPFHDSERRKKNGWMNACRFTTLSIILQS